MIKHNPYLRRSGRLAVVSRAALLLGLAVALAACGDDKPAEEQAAPATSAAAPVVTPETAVSDEVTAMSAQDLRDAARKAYGENRLYAPAGDNAVEYYLALREKAPEDASVSSALTDLLPMTVIAIEQSINRGDFAEAARLAALLEKAEPQHPALARLKSSITSQRQAAIEREEQQALSATEEAERQEELERQRQAEQEQQQAEAARQLAAQQAAEREAAQQRAAEQAAAAELVAQQEEAAEQQQAVEQSAAREQAAPDTATVADLRPLSTPAPRFPPDAYRSRTSGEVQVEFTVGVDGSVTSARVVRSEPRRVFDRAAIDAVEEWRFQPISTPVTTRRTIAFNPGG